MRGWRVPGFLCLIAAAMLWVGTSFALEPGPKCQSRKNKSAGKLSFCLQKAEAKFLKTRS